MHLLGLKPSTQSSRYYKCLIQIVLRGLSVLYSMSRICKFDHDRAVKVRTTKILTRPKTDLGENLYTIPAPNHRKAPPDPPQTGVVTHFTPNLLQSQKVEEKL